MARRGDFMALNSVNAAFEGFAIIRREPKTLLIWAGALVGVQAVSLGAMYAMGISHLNLPQTAEEMRSFTNWGGLVGLGLAAIMIALILYSAATCAVYRAVLRPQDTAFGRLRLGADEGRMLLLILVLWLLFFAAYIAFIIVGVVLAGVLSAGGSGGAAAGALVVFVLVIAFFVFFAWLSVQLSLAAPMTFATGQLQVFRSMRLVKGNFWNLLGCYLLAFVVLFGLYIVLGMVQATLMTAVGGPSAFDSFVHPQAKPDMSAMFKPATIAVTLFINLFGALLYPIMLAPAAAAYRDIAGPDSTSRAEVFA
jgi:hypothetical protein